MDNEPENAHFTEALAAVRNVWDENRLNACIEEAIELLEPMHLPGYHRMSKVLLLASCVGDRNLADLYCQEGEILWEIMRLWKPKGGTAIDAAMDRLYTIITVLKREIKAEQVEFSAKARADADAEGARNLKKEEGEDERNSEVKEEQPAGAQNYRVEVQAEEARHNSLRRVDSCHDDNNSQSGPDPVKSLSYTRSRAPGGIDAMTQDSYRKQTENAVQDPGDDGTAPATQDIDGLSVTRDSQAIKRDELEKLEAELAAASARRSPINASHTPNTQEAAPRHGFLPIWPAAPKTQTKAIDDSKFKLHKVGLQWLSPSFANVC